MDARKIMQLATAKIIEDCAGFTNDPVTDPWDVNNGFCEDWAQYVSEQLPGAESIWLDEIARTQATHCVVRYKGKLYDAECLSGVRDWKQLPLVRNRRKTRAQVIASRPETV